MTSAVVVPQVGYPVQYKGREGQWYAAQILLTATEFDPAKARFDQRPLDVDEVNLAYIRPVSGRTIVHTYVPRDGSEAHEKLIAQAQAYIPADAELAGATALVRCWRPIPGFPYQTV